MSLKKRFARRTVPAALFSLLLLADLSPRQCLADNFHNAISLEGMTGVLNTPNAAVTGEGIFDALYSDQKDGRYAGNLTHEDSYMVSVGMFKYLEVGGRFSEAVARRGTKGGMRDISGNVKLRIPFIPEGKYIPQVAVGAQDFAGGVHHLRSAYLVGSEELWRFRFSAGAGTGPDRMKGAFAGAEFKTCDWLYLLADYDTVDTNIGARLVVPELFGIPVRLQGTIKDSLNNSRGPEFGLGFQIPLGSEHFNSRPVKEEKGESAASSNEVSSAPGNAGTTPLTASDCGSGLPAANAHAVCAQKASATGEVSQNPAQLRTALPPNHSDADILVTRPQGDKPYVGKALLSSQRERLVHLREMLAREGFQNLAVGAGTGGVLVVEYENERYNKNELDGMGVVAGIICEEEWPDFRTLRLVMKKKDIRILQLSVPIAELRDFLADANRLESFKGSLSITDEIADDRDVHYLQGGRNPSWLRPSLVLYPELKTFVGTEYSPFDYLLSLKPDLFVPLWKGAVADARWDIPVSWSSGFDDGGPFRDLRRDSRMDRLMLFQAVKLSPSVMANLGAGMVQYRVNGTLDELFWSPVSSNHRLGVRFAYGNSSESKEHFQSYLGSYRYYFSPLNTFLEGTGGKFWGGDTGFRLDLKRFFGDTSFSFYYKRVNGVDRSVVQAAGVQFTFPLTPRRDMNPSIAQVKGTNAWTYEQESQVGNERGKNVVGRSLAIVPEPYYNLTDVFYNRDRLTESYIKTHLLRLRDAYLKYVVQQ